MSTSQHPGAHAPWFGVATPSGGSSWGGRSLLRPFSALAAALMIGGSYFFSWWTFVLYAPQYPHGLRLVVSLKGVSGDVHEVNMLNHYIGMKSLELAAPWERAASAYAIAALAIGVVLCGSLPNRWFQRAALALSLVLPLGFLVDSWLWLAHFGHALDHHAPIRLPPFTPQMFGNGVIGQFMTFAQPSSGFWVALLAPVALAVGQWLAQRTTHEAGPS